MSLPKSRLVNDASHGCEHAAAGLVDTTSATDSVSVVRSRLGAMMPTRVKTARCNFSRQVFKTSGPNIAAPAACQFGLVVKETKRPDLLGRPHCKGVAIGVARRGARRSGERTLRIPPSCSFPVSHACGPHAASFVRRPSVCALASVRACGRAWRAAQCEASRKNERLAKKRVGTLNKKRAPCVLRDHRGQWERRVRSCMTPDEVPDAGCGGSLGDDDAIDTRTLSCAGSGDGARVAARQ